MSRFAQLFPAARPLVGMISLPPSPGYPAFRSAEELVACALADLAALEEGGADGVLIENDYDQPHALTVGPEVVAAMTRVTREVAARARVPVGVQVLLNDWRASLGVAAACGASFVRLDFFVDRVRIAAGEIEPEPEAVVAYRRAIRAEHILLVTDLQVKYSVPVGPPKPLAESAREARAAGADALVVTGPETGVGPRAEDLRAARAAGLPVLIGSGLTPANAPELMPEAGGAIVGTFLRSSRSAEGRVVAARVRELRAQIRQDVDEPAGGR